jgi:hypothetical protein
MTSILDWIGFKADRVSLKTFFAQKGFTILAAWEALKIAVLRHRHLVALDVLLSIHLSIRDQSPWSTGTRFHKIESYLKLAPNRTAELINAYPCTRGELHRALNSFVVNNGPIEVVRQLLRTGASLRNKGGRPSVGRLIRYFGSQECQEVDIALLETLFDAGAIVDELPSRCHRLGWPGPDEPRYDTDYLLLSGGHSTNGYGLWPLVSSYSDRQQTTVTVPGIFAAARDGPEQLQSYLNSRSKPYDEHDRKQVLEIALSEASGRGYTNVLQSLVQFGVDPNLRMLPKKHDVEGSLNKWHPVIRAANNGKVDTLRVLVIVSDLDIGLLDEQVASGYLDLCALRNMESSQLKQVLRLLSTLDFATTTRNEILLSVLEPRNCGSGHDDPDFGFVDQLLELGLASVDRVYLRGKPPGPQLLVHAIRRGCGIRALGYLQVEQAMRVISASSLRMLLEATLSRNKHRERHTILEFLAQQIRGLEAYVRENSSSLLSYFLREPPACGCASEAMPVATVEWFLGLGATLDISGFARLIRHATQSFMMAIIDGVRDIKVVDKSFALKEAIASGRHNLAVALIERGAQINSAHERGYETILEYACMKGSPLWFIRFLLKEGADVNATPEVGLTALQSAAATGSMNTVGMLLDYGADVNAPRYLSYNRTTLRAIDVAVQYSKLDMVHFLIEAGGRSGYPGLTGFDGAIQIATRDRHFAIADLLKKHADSHCRDRMEAERLWLEEYSAARMEMDRNEAEF